MAAVLVLAGAASFPLALAAAGECAAPVFGSGGPITRMAADDSLVAVTDGNHVLTSADGGCTFTTLTARETQSLTDLAVVDGEVFLLVLDAAGPQLWSAAANGQWAVQTLEGCGIGCGLAAAGNDLYLFGETLLRSTDAGTTWEPVALPGDAGRTLAVTGDGTTLWVATDSRLLRGDPAGFEPIANLDQPMDSLAVVAGSEVQIFGATAGQLLRLHPGTVEPAQPGEALQVSAVGGSLLVLTTSGLQWHQVPAPAEAPARLRAERVEAEVVSDPEPAEVPVPVGAEADAVPSAGTIETTEDTIEGPAATEPMSIIDDLPTAAPTVIPATAVKDAATPAVELLDAALPQEGIRIGARADAAGEEPADVDAEQSDDADEVGDEPELVAAADEPPAPAADPTTPAHPTPTPASPVSPSTVAVTAAGPAQAPWLATTAQLTGVLAVTALLALVVVGFAPRLSPVCAAALGLSRHRRRR